MTGIQTRGRVWGGIAPAMAACCGMLIISQSQPALASVERDHPRLAMALVEKFFGKEEQKPVAPPPGPASAKPPAAPVKPAPVPNQPAGATAAGKPGAPVPSAQPTAPSPGTPGKPGPSSPVASPPAADSAKGQSTLGISPVVVPGTPSKPAVPAPSSSAPSTPLARQGQPVTSVPATPSADTVGDVYSYDPKSRRDPFQSMVQKLKTAQRLSELPPLQRVEISDMKLLGIIWGGYGYYGLIQTPDGKGYTVKEGMLLGAHNGVIKSISDKRVLVSEPITEVTGKTSTREIEILLRTKEVPQ